MHGKLGVRHDVASGWRMIGWLRGSLVPQRAFLLSVVLLLLRITLGGGLVIAGKGKIAKLQGQCATAPLPDCETDAIKACEADAACKLAVPAKCEKDRKKECADQAEQTLTWFDGLTIADHDNWKMPGGGRLNLMLAGIQEALFGALVLIGLFGRLAALPLTAVMTVAMLTAHWKTFNSQLDFTAEVAFCYLVMALVVAAVGPGLLSLDALWATKPGGAPKPKVAAK